jgi:hypothetical protein
MWMKNMSRKVSRKTEGGPIMSMPAAFSELGREANALHYG